MGSAPVINAQRIQVTDRFAYTVDLRVAAQRSVMLKEPPSFRRWCEESQHEGSVAGGSSNKQEHHYCPSAGWHA